MAIIINMFLIQVKKLQKIAYKIYKTKFFIFPQRFPKALEEKWKFKENIRFSVFLLLNSEFLQKFREEGCKEREGLNKNSSKITNGKKSCCNPRGFIFIFCWMLQVVAKKV